MTTIGIALFALTALVLLVRYLRAERPYPFPRHGAIGAAIVLTGEAFLFLRLEPVGTYFTAIAWTGYILWADAAVFSIRGKSLLKTYPAEFAWIAFASIPLWLIFEAYNLRLRNWVYFGLPRNWLALHFGYAWAFSTIWPAILETATLWRSLSRRLPEPSSPYRSRQLAQETVSQPQAHSRSPQLTIAMLVGAILLIVPLLVPEEIASYLFGAVWLGFIFLLEPLNFRLGRESLLRDIRLGDFSRLQSLLVAGWICGIFWEFWNWWATARWVYFVPILPEWKIFAMPVLGYLGFPPFAVECFAMLAFLAPAINRLRNKLGSMQPLNWEAFRL
ncbi:MAG: hypothetical protein HY648_09925 [Acidobacteria bacterium]|nr:hypothetical protein [Acidobacteriota bacterium]